MHGNNLRVSKGQGLSLGLQTLLRTTPSPVERTARREEVDLQNLGQKNDAHKSGLCRGSRDSSGVCVIATDFLILRENIWVAAIGLLWGCTNLIVKATSEGVSVQVATIAHHKPDCNEHCTFHSPRGLESPRSRDLQAQYLMKVYLLVQRWYPRACPCVLIGAN